MFSVLSRLGIRLPPRVVGWVSVRALLNAHADSPHRGQGTAETLGVEPCLQRIARADPTCRLLMTAPDVEPLTAFAFAAAGEDPSRFRRTWDAGACLGLTSKQYQSGDVNIGGRTYKCGDRLTRKLLFDAARVILYRTRTPSRPKN